MAILLNETKLGSVGTLDGSICGGMALDRYTSAACYHGKVTRSLESCHWLSEDVSTCLPVCVCPCMRLGPEFAVTNESQTHVNAHFTHIARSWRWEYIALATGDALTRPWTLFLSAAMRYINSEDDKSVQEYWKPADVMFSPLFFSCWFVILQAQRLCLPWMTFHLQVKWFISNEMSEGGAAGKWRQWQGVKKSKAHTGRFSVVVLNSAMACFCFLLMFTSICDLAFSLHLRQKTGSLPREHVENELALSQRKCRHCGSFYCALRRHSICGTGR